MKIIGVAGFLTEKASGLTASAGAGKGTLTEALARHKYVELALADPLKRFCREVFGFSVEQLWGPSEARNKIDPRWGISPREALQQLGTNWGRQLHPEVWVRHLEGTLNALSHPGVNYYYTRGIFTVSGHRVRSVVVHDCRYDNELQAIRNLGGQIWAVTREVDKLPVEVDFTHSSETSLTWLPSQCDKVFENNGTREELQALVELAIAGEV